MVKNYIPAKGDVVLINLNPQKGKEQAGYRPALIISPLKYNKKVGLALVVPITHGIKGYPFEVPLVHMKNIEGVILADHVRSIDWQERKVKFLEKVHSSCLDETIEKLNVLIQKK